MFTETEAEIPKQDEQAEKPAKPEHPVAALIRNRSENGELTRAGEIAQALAELLASFPEGEKEEALREMIRKGLEENPDLTEIAGQDGPRYYSRIYMTDPYAKLLIRKEGDPLVLIAETVRENSRIYPRPIHKDTFRNPPFDLTDEEIATCLKRMSEDEQYRDILETTTSIHTVFLYSTLHLEPDYASMLAEWIDVGQHANP